MIATPLGNRNDITLRALETFKTLETFFAEDTRELGKLLEIYGIPHREKKILSYASHNMKEATERALEILAEGRDVGFVSDRGTPGISDPGALLAREAWNAGVSVVPVPGASSVAAALSVCGYRCDQYVFLGFLPTTTKDRNALWDNIRRLGFTVCFFESPKRIRETVMELKAAFPRGSVFLAREMTKVFESFTRYALETVREEDIVEKGEYVVALDMGPTLAATPSDWEADVKLRLAPEKEWAKTVAARHGVTSSEIYNALQRMKKM